MSLTDARMDRAIALSVAEGSLATVMGTLLGGVFLTGFALEIGATRIQIGVLAALPTLSHVAQFLGAELVNRTGRTRRWCLLATWISRLLWVPLLLLAWCWNPSDGVSFAWLMIAVLLVSGCCGSIGGLAWIAWIHRLIPSERRIEFFSRRNLYNSGLSVVLSLLAAIAISMLTGVGAKASEGFLGVFAFATVLGLIGVFLLGRMPSADQGWGERSDFKMESMSAASPSYRRLLGGYAAWQFATQMAAPFYAVFMLQKLQLPFVGVMAVTTVGSLMALSVNGWWAKLKLRYGVRPVVLVATALDVLLPLSWLFIHPQTWWLVVPVQVFLMLNPPLVMGPQNLLLKVSTQRKAASYMALFNATTGTIGGLGAIVGGWLATNLSGNWNVGAFEMSGIQLVFLLSLIGKVCGLILLTGVHEEGASDVPAMLRRVSGWKYRGETG